jgi:hypothetical protein
MDRIDDPERLTLEVGSLGCRQGRLRQFVEDR